jgi:hypothetical protein
MLFIVKLRFEYDYGQEMPVNVDSNTLPLNMQ